MNSDQEANDFETPLKIISCLALTLRNTKVGRDLLKKCKPEGQAKSDLLILMEWGQEQIKIVDNESKPGKAEKAGSTHLIILSFQILAGLF